MPEQPVCPFCRSHVYDRTRRHKGAPTPYGCTAALARRVQDLKDLVEGLQDQVGELLERTVHLGKEAVA